MNTPPGGMAFEPSNVASNRTILIVRKYGIERRFECLRKFTLIPLIHSYCSCKRCGCQTRLQKLCKRYPDLGILSYVENQRVIRHVTRIQPGLIDLGNQCFLYLWPQLRYQLMNNIRKNKRRWNMVNVVDIHKQTVVIDQVRGSKVPLPAMVASLYTKRDKDSSSSKQLEA